ncbi:DUF6415 family natural product biosynthesis protein [Streptomyces sp. NBC_00932]|uniref:DUF6415 family natural product biosynthesis protein n=1 Tax=Streptomyces sp. NBC_00932 TaxID=2903690 RepID=UPI003866BCAD
MNPEDVARMTPVLGRVLDQLVNIAHQKSGGPPTAELLEVSERADPLQARRVPESAEQALAHLRRLAIALVDLLGLTTLDDGRPPLRRHPSSASQPDRSQQLARHRALPHRDGQVAVPSALHAGERRQRTAPQAWHRHGAEDQPGQTWQERWLASGIDQTGSAWRPAIRHGLHERGLKAAWRMPVVGRALTTAISADLLRPLVDWLAAGPAAKGFWCQLRLFCPFCWWCEFLHFVYWGSGFLDFPAGGRIPSISDLHQMVMYVKGLGRP